MNSNEWVLKGRTVKGDLAVSITVRDQYVLAFEPKELFAPAPSRLLGFAVPRPEDGDEEGRNTVISSGRNPEVTYEQATEEGAVVAGTNLRPYFYGAGPYEVILSVIVDSFEEIPAQNVGGSKAETGRKGLDDPLPGDDEIVQITKRQALKISALMSRVADNDAEYSKMLIAAANFLSGEAERQSGAVVPWSTSKLWDAVDAFPWPTKNSTDK